MSIMDIFRKQPSTQPAANPTNPANTNPTIPNDQTNPIPQPDGSKSSLDKFDKLWEKDNAASPAPTASMIPNLNIDLSKLREGAAKLDFVGHIPQDLITKAMAGDAQSFAQVINQAVQLGFAQSAAASAEITKQSLTTAQGALESQVLPAAIRQNQISREIANKNPVFSDPAVSPMLDMMKDQFARKYPTAAPEDIATLAQEYLSGFASKIVSGSGGTIVEKPASRQVGSQPREDTDWSTWLQ